MNKDELVVSDYRYERKYFITSLSKYEVECVVKMHPAAFSEIFHQRFVNNLYFDTVCFGNFRDNVEGATDRLKVRVRWYGELFGDIQNPTLELKIKKGLLGKKVSMKINPFTLKADSDLSGVLGSVSETQDTLKIDYKSLKPALINRYSRRYYRSSDRCYRITIDGDQSFYEVNGKDNFFLNRIVDRDSVILELKYQQDHDSGAGYISTAFPFRLTKSSKYVRGIQQIMQLAY